MVKGVLAVIGQVTEDRRVLMKPDRKAFNPKIHRPSIYIGQVKIGTVDRMWRDGDLVRYTGEITDPKAQELVRLGLVWPSVGIGATYEDDQEIGPWRAHDWWIQNVYMFLVFEPKIWPEASCDPVEGER